MKNKVSIIISSYKTKEMTLELLKSINQLSYKNKEIILIDDGGNDSTIERANKIFPKVKTIKNKKNMGFSKSNNIGIKKASGEYIIILNSDVLFPDKKILEKMINIFHKYKNAALAVCKVIGIDNKLQTSFNNPDIEQEFKIGGGPIMFFRADILKKLGGFDEGFSPAYYEDTDLSLRIKKMGYKLIYTPSTYIMHLGGATTKNLTDFYYSSSFKNSIRFSIIYMNFFEFLLFNIRDFFKSIYRNKLKLYLNGWVINLKEISNLIRLRKERKVDFNFFTERFF
jgi:hypothetical protein